MKDRKVWIPIFVILGVITFIASSILLHWLPILIKRAQLPKDSPEYYQLTRQLMVAHFSDSEFRYREEGAFLICVFDEQKTGGKYQVEVATKENGAYRLSTNGIRTFHLLKEPFRGVYGVYYDSASESYCAVIEAQTDPNSGNHANSWNTSIIEDSQGNAYQRLPVQNQQINVFYHVYDNSPDGVTIFANWKESESAYELGTFSDPVSGTSIGG